MDLSNIINNDNLQQVKNEFNSASFDFNDVAEQKLVDIADDKYVDVQQIEMKKQRECMIKDLFSLLANSSDVSYIIRTLKTKYGKLVDDKVITCCMKLCDVIGNYLITCRYNDNLGNKNPSFVKYVLFCDCGDTDCVKNQLGTGSIDGLFKENKKIVVPKVKMCKKHHLPVLANIDDLTAQDFNALVKRVSQVNKIQPQQKEENNKKANVITKIARVFYDLRVAKREKHDTSKYELKQANTQLIASVSNKINAVNIENLEKPKDINVKLKHSNKLEKVNLPTNNITVNVNNHKKSMNAFTIKANQYKELQLSNVKDADVKIMAKDMAVAVEKQSKYVQNICLKTKPVDQGFDIKDDFVFDLEKKNIDDISIDTKNEFNF